MSGIGDNQVYQKFRLGSLPGKRSDAKWGTSGKIPLITGLIIQNPVGRTSKRLHIFSISCEITMTIKNRYGWHSTIIQSIAPRTSTKNADKFGLHLFFIPAGMTDAYQPLDRYIFGVIKAACRRMDRQLLCDDISHG